MLQPEFVAAAFATAFAVAAVAVCGLLAAQGRTQRKHETAMIAAQVGEAVGDRSAASGLLLCRELGPWGCSVWRQGACSAFAPPGQRAANDWQSAHRSVSRICRRRRRRRRMRRASAASTAHCLAPPRPWTAACWAARRQSACSTAAAAAWSCPTCALAAP